MFRKIRRGFSVALSPIVEIFLTRKPYENKINFGFGGGSNDCLFFAAWYNEKDVIFEEYI